MRRQHLSIELPIYLFILLIVVVLLAQNVKAQTNKVSPKLDFDDPENETNSAVPIMPGIGQSDRVDGKQSGNGADSGSGRGEGESTATIATSSNSGTGKHGPKIHGVRVTVDTGDTQKSKEAAESAEITDVVKHKKRVGIHTDITFEISTDGDGDGDANGTSSAQDENASVPIFKGHNGPTQKARKPYDPKNHWNPNFSAERRSYDSRDHDGGPSYGPSYPQYYPNNVPVYTAAGDGGGSGGGNAGSGYRRGDGWNTYVPNSIRWTTERANSEQYRPNTVTGYRTSNWKPCYCIASAVDTRRRRTNAHGPRILQEPTSSAIHMVNGKLEKPFFRK